METDYGVSIVQNSYISIPANNAYNFGVGDFTITILFQSTQPGTLISRKSTAGGSSTCAGWLLVLKPNGVIKMATDNGFGFYEVNSVETCALDGTWHSIAAVRKQGAIIIYFDGNVIPVTPRCSLPSPLDVSNNLRVLIGNCDQNQEVYKQFIGVVEDITIWNIALEEDQIKRTMFDLISPEDPGLIGLWEMNLNFKDSSNIKNNAAPCGAVKWIPVFHCVWAEGENNYSYCAIDLNSNANEDFGAKVNNGGRIIISSNYAYNFGKGDFSVTAVFRTISPGTLVSRKSSEGGSSECAGWLLVVKPNGIFKFATDNGYGFYEVNSNPTNALDGYWHGVTAIRRSGQLLLYFDGISIPSTPLSSLPTPLDVSNHRGLVIGNCDQLQEEYKQFIGVIEDVSIWNKALSDQEIQDARLNTLNKDSPNIVGFWEMDNNFNDSSIIKNNGTSNGAVSFVPVYHQAKREQTLQIKEGTPYLYGMLMSKDMDSSQFPEGAILKVYLPNGSTLDKETSTDTLFVHMIGQSVQAFIIKKPQVGTWRFSIEATTDNLLLVSIQTTPTMDVSKTIQSALSPIYRNVPSCQVRYLLEYSPSKLEAFSWGWTDVAKWAGITLAAVAVVAIAVVVVFGAPVTLPTLAAVGGALAISSQLLMNIGLMGDIAKSRYEIANQIGIISPTPGGTNCGSVRFIIDGRDYFTQFKNLLLAVQAGTYEFSGILAPANPTFENLINGISNAGKEAYILMWDTSDIYFMAENNDFLKYYLRKWLKGKDPKRNQLTAKALSNLPNISIGFEKYTPYLSVSPTNVQHQKLAVFSVDNVKCALVGGFNIITPSYWDDPDHPMNDHSNFHTWHDTAVLIQGPVVNMIENEFNRRWSYAKMPSEIDNSGTYAKIACWQINHDSCFDEECICSKGQPSKNPYKNPITDDSQYPIDVLITESQFPYPITKIKDKILEKIKIATQYIYFENFAFHDVDIVKAITEKMKTVSENFHCIINIPYPTKGNDHEDQIGQFFMSRIAIGSIILSGNEWVFAAFAEGTIVSRDSCSNYSVYIPEDKPIEYAVFKYTIQGRSYELSIRDYLCNIEQTPDSRIILTSPVRYFNTLNPNEEKFQLPGLSINFRSIYIHSKLALFDDQVAIIGSANFTTRSLKWDGECSVCINDNNKVREMRTAIFTHWGADTPSNWRQKMENFSTNPAEGVGPVPLSLSVLTTNPPLWIWDYITAVIDPSDIY